MAQPLSFLIKADSAAARAELQRAINAIYGFGNATLTVNESAAKAWRETQAAVTAAAGATAAATRRVQDEANNAVRSGNAVTGNLVAQFNDIGMMLAAGQNPLMLALQQGTQVSQALGPLGLAGSVKALGAAFVGMLSPVSLVTFAVIAGGAALAQWAIAALSAGEEAKTVEDQVKSLTDAVNAYRSAAEAASAPDLSIADQFGMATEQARALLEIQREIAQVDAERQAALVARGVADRFGALERPISTEPTPTFAPLVAQFGQLNPDTVAEIADAFGVTTEKAILLAQEMVNIGTATGPAEQAAAMARLRASIEDATGGIGAMSKETFGLFISLTDAEEAALRLAAVRSMDAATSQTMQANLKAEADMAALIAVYGADSVEVSRAQIDQERALFAAKIANLDIDQQSRDAIMDQWELSKGNTAAIQADTATARDMLATLQGQADMQALIARYGADSAQVAAAKAEQERASFAAQAATLDITEEMRTRLMAAWDAAKGIATTNMASGIGAAASAAARLARDMNISLAAASGLLAMGGGPKPVILDPRDPRYDATAATAARLREQAGTVSPFDVSRLSSSGTGSPGGGGGGGQASTPVSDLAGAGKKAMDDLSLAVAGINEKVKAGLLTTAEGVNAVDQAHERTANSLAELIPKIEAIGGPASVSAVGNLRTALKELVGEIGAAGSELKDKLSDGISKPFEQLLVDAGKGKQAFASFTDSVLSNIARIVSQRFTQSFITPVINTLLGAFGFAQGGVPEMEAYAMGGLPGLPNWRNEVVDQPTMFGMGGNKTGLMGEAGPEAIIPLVRGAGGLGVRATGADGKASVLPLQRASGGALGVKLPDWAQAFAMGGVPNVALPVWQPPSAPRAGAMANYSAAQPGQAQGGAAEVKVEMNITNNAPGTEVKQTGSRVSGGRAIVDVLISQVKGAMMEDVARGGDFSDAMSASFGLQRQGR